MIKMITLTWIGAQKWLDLNVLVCKAFVLFFLQVEWANGILSWLFVYLLKTKGYEQLEWGGVFYGSGGFECSFYPNPEIKGSTGVPANLNLNQYILNDDDNLDILHEADTRNKNPFHKKSDLK